MLKDFQLLEKNGFELLPYGVGKTFEECAAIAKKIKYPVALKLISPDATHKTEVGGVKIGVNSDEGLCVAYKDMVNSAKKHKIKIDGILVQKMARKGIELIIGGKLDQQFGHMIVLGLGGIYVEIFRDISARLCPISARDVDEMIAELKSHPLITGARGKKAIAIKDVRKIMLSTCKFMAREKIKEIDINPLICDEKGCDIVDVRFKR
ncbi:acetate--CoA ligase family protein [Candidatus Micrarchaeota archaeon]|nr:acetate--CoA ligase family protein [Candidatus Micrarchaeota archaeon]